MDNALKMLNRKEVPLDEWEAVELLLMPSIVSAFARKIESAAPKRPRLRDMEWTVLETNVSIS